MDFEAYLKGRQLGPATQKTYKKYHDIFLSWIEATEKDPIHISYNDLLAYIAHCNKIGLKTGYINKLLGVVRHYYNYLKYIGTIRDNPATGLYLRGKRSRLPHDLLTENQMEEIYQNYKGKGLVGKRNKIMLGLMIYQGLRREELELLQEHHLRLREGKIEVPRTGRRAKRTLKLDGHQIADLQEYLLSTRLLLVKKSAKQTERLFLSTGESQSISSIVNGLMRQLRKENHFFINGEQLRQSRIGLWIRQYDLRQVQYMAGHKYVSSTERYSKTHLEDLQKELSKHHPMG